jgi:hypothetical protein
MSANRPILFANLSQLALERAQINAIVAMIPDLEETEKLPRGAKDLSEGYILLRARERYPHFIGGIQGDCIKAYIRSVTGSDPHTNVLKLHKWARFRLPNGQVARSLWKESLKAADKCRRARCVQVIQAYIFSHYIQMLNNFIS